MPVQINPSLKRLLEVANTTPLEAIEEVQSNYKRAESTHNQKIHETLTVAAALVLKLRASPEDRAAFYRHEFWEGEHVIEADERLPRYMLRFSLGAKTAKGALYEQARHYASVVEHCLDEGLSPPEILERLSRSSVHRVTMLISQQPGRAARRTSAPPVGPQHRAVAKAHADANDSISGSRLRRESEENDAVDDENCPEAEREEETRRQGGRSIQTGQPEAGQSSGGSDDTPERRSTFNTNRDMSFDADRFFGRILSIGEGDEVMVTLRREKSGSSWIKLKAIDVQRVLQADRHLL